MKIGSLREKSRNLVLWRTALILLFAFAIIDVHYAFTTRPQPISSWKKSKISSTAHIQPSWPRLSSLSSSQIIDYEYIPADDNNDNNSGHDYQTSLPSIYPEGTPAGLRGEAVRTALKSSQCLAWKLETTTTKKAATTSDYNKYDKNNNLASGILQLSGKGVLDFLHNKLSNSFVASDLKGIIDQNSKEPQTKHLKYKQACLLTPKGRLVDTLSVAYDQTQAWILPSPGHEGADLFSKLDPFIFPMDQVTLRHVVDDDSTTPTVLLFTLASTCTDHVQTAVNDHLLPQLNKLLKAQGKDPLQALDLPKKSSNALVIHLHGEEGGPQLVIFPSTGLPECAVIGYTFAFVDDKNNIGNQVWQHLVSNDNIQGPVEIKALEYESLRIQAGQPAFGHEITGAWKDPDITSPTPLELHLKTSVIDLEKGCYLGQEGIASVLKNPRGPPRSLYVVVFQDDDNLYEHQTKGESSTQSNRVENLTKLPQPGQKLYVLGSNEKIEVGTLTSVAEPYSTGEPTIRGLALIRRADSVLKQMKSMEDLQMPRAMVGGTIDMEDVMRSGGGGGSGIVAPPPMDSLDGLEVIVGGTFTVGRLQSIPSRRYPKGKNMFTDEEQVLLTREEILDQGYVDIDFSGKNPMEVLEEKAAEMEDQRIMEAKEAVVEVEEPTDQAKMADDEDDEAEAKRKAAKMELLKQRAEEAMARRKQKKQEAQESMKKEEVLSEDEEAAEAKRKAEKMQMLQKRAEEAIARRKKKKEQQG